MKIHVRVGTGNNCETLPLCAHNGRHYDRLPADYVKSAKEFRLSDPAERCALCMDLYLIKRNAQRKEKGLMPVETAFEGLTAKV